MCSLDPFQSVFRPQHRTETALAALQDSILREADRGCITLLVFLDLSDTFDIVSHGILGMLSSLEIGGSILHWLWSFLDGQSQVMHLEDDPFGTSIM